MKGISKFIPMDGNAGNAGVNAGTGIENAGSVGGFGAVNAGGIGGFGAEKAGNGATGITGNGGVAETGNSAFKVCGTSAAGTNLPAKQTFWSKLKGILTYEIKVELTPYEQKIEDEINEFLHQEITWQSFKNFLFKEITFGKKNKA